MASHTSPHVETRGGIIAPVDPQLTISGSYRKHLSAILAARATFLAAGIEVLRPRSERILSDSDGFVRLEDDLDDARAAALAQRQAIRESHLVYVVNPGGYVGPSAIYEVGLASGLGIPVCFSEQPFETAARLSGEALIHWPSGAGERWNMIGDPEQVAGHLLARCLAPADRSLLTDLVNTPELVLARGPRIGASFTLDADGEGLSLRSDDSEDPVAFLSGTGVAVLAPEESRIARMLRAISPSRAGTGSRARDSQEEAQ